MITIIAAVAENRAIGFENKLIYWLPNDLKRFKSLTTGHTIIMGSNTFRSLPKGPLPNRRNVVLSRRDTFFDPSQEGERGYDVFPSLESALKSCQPDEEVFIIGGASVYQQAIGMADRLCLTEIHDVPAQADTFFPDYSDWHETAREEHVKDERHAFNYAFVEYQKTPSPIRSR